MVLGTVAGIKVGNITFNYSIFEVDGGVDKPNYLRGKPKGCLPLRGELT